MICIHKPQKLADEILPRYFRHGKFASFQRQLNYFGFRKASGKGKKTPCVYHNQCTTDDINSLFQVKVSDLYCTSCNISILILCILNYYRKSWEWLLVNVQYVKKWSWSKMLHFKSKLWTTIKTIHFIVLRLHYFNNHHLQ